MKVRLTDIDSKIPNLALMKLAHFHQAQRDDVYLTKHATRQLFEPKYQRVYGSAIFQFSAPKIETFRREWPEAILGGTGIDLTTTVESIIGREYEEYDYSIYPDYKFSIGFTQRGCRLACGFCVVPKKEGRPRTASTIHSIWRGPSHPRNIVLLDNDFFGQPRDQWQYHILALKKGGFKVCFNQGLNIRLIDEEACAALASIKYYDDQFKVRRLYIAWDNLKDEAIFFRGVDMLERAGIPPRHLMVYMLIGYDPDETWERIMYRFERMKARGILVYQMVYQNRRPDLKWFQRWVIQRFHQVIPWEKFSLQGLRTARLREREGTQEQLFS